MIMIEKGKDLSSSYKMLLYIDLHEIDGPVYIMNYTIKCNLGREVQI